MKLQHPWPKRLRGGTCLSGRLVGLLFLMLVLGFLYGCGGGGGGGGSPAGPSTCVWDATNSKWDNCKWGP